MSKKTALTSTARRNIDAIARVEKQLLRKRSGLERLGAGVARFFGSLPFIIAQAAFVFGWIFWNTGKRPPMHPFDPYPFPFLSLIIGIEFIVLTTFVLMNQTYQMRREEHWSHLHLQLSMLTEQEMTKNLELLIRLCDRLGLKDLARDEEVKELTRPTPVHEIIGEIAKARGEGEPAVPTVEPEPKHPGP